MTSPVLADNGNTRQCLLWFSLFIILLWCHLTWGLALMPAALL